MRLIRRIRFSMGTIMMFVLMAAAVMALFVKIRQHTDAVLPAGWKIDVPSLFLLAIGLTALALGSWKEHSTVQMMLQVTFACVGGLTSATPPPPSLPTLPAAPTTPNPGGL